MLVARLVELWEKKIFFLGLPKTYTYCENSAGFSKAAPETHKYTEVYDISERLHLFVE